MPNIRINKHLGVRKYTFIVLGCFLILQDASIITSDAYPQNGQGFLFGLPRPIPLLRNIVHGVGETIENIVEGPQKIQTTASTTTTTTTTTPPPTSQQSNPFQFILNIFQPHNSTSTTTTTTTEISTTKPANFFDGISNFVLGIVDPFKIFQSKKTVIVTTTAAPDPIGGIFNGIGNLFGWAPTTTTTTLYPPPLGGRGFSGLAFNIINIFNDMLDMLDNVLLINDDWVPGYMLMKVSNIQESIQNIIEIFLQYDQPGGLGDIWKSLTQIWNDLNEMFKVVSSGDVGALIGLPIQGGKTLGDIGKFNDQFKLHFPTTTPTPGVKPHASERIKLNNKEFQKILNHSENMVKNLLHIEEVVEEIFPNNTILQFVGNFRKSLEKSLNDSKTTGKPIVLNTIETMFPNDELANYIAEFGKILSQFFSYIPPIQVAGMILQQKFVVNIALNIIGSFINPILGNIEKFFENIIENILTRYLSFDSDHFILNLIQTFEERFGSFGKYLEQFRDLNDKLKLNFTEGDVFQQVIDIAMNITTSPETYDLLRETVAQILKLIPFDFGEDAVHGVTSAITYALTSVIHFLSRGLQMIFPQRATQMSQFINSTTPISNVM